MNKKNNSFEQIVLKRHCRLSLQMNAVQSLSLNVIREKTSWDGKIQQTILFTPGIQTIHLHRSFSKDMKKEHCWKLTYPPEGAQPQLPCSPWVCLWHFTIACESCMCIADCKWWMPDVSYRWQITVPQVIMPPSWGPCYNGKAISDVKMLFPGDKSVMHGLIMSWPCRPRLTAAKEEGSLTIRERSYKRLLAMSIYWQNHRK